MFEERGPRERCRKHRRLHSAQPRASRPPRQKTRRAVFDAVIRDRAMVFDEMAARKTRDCGPRRIPSSCNGLTIWPPPATGCRRSSSKGPPEFRRPTSIHAWTKRGARNTTANAPLAQASASFREQLRGNENRSRRSGGRPRSRRCPDRLHRNTAAVRFPTGQTRSFIRRLRTPGWRKRCRL